MKCNSSVDYQNFRVTWFYRESWPVPILYEKLLSHLESKDYALLTGRDVCACVCLCACASENCQSVLVVF